MCLCCLRVGKMQDLTEEMNLHDRTFFSLEDVFWFSSLHLAPAGDTFSFSLTKEEGTAFGAHLRTKFEDPAARPVRYDARRTVWHGDRSRLDDTIAILWEFFPHNFVRLGALPVQLYRCGVCNSEPSLRRRRRRTLAGERAFRRLHPEALDPPAAL